MGWEEKGYERKVIFLIFELGVRVKREKKRAHKKIFFFKKEFLL